MSFLGKHHSQETRNKISKANVGENNHGYGKKHSQEHKNKISASLMGHKHHEETKKKISTMLLGKPKSAEHKLSLSRAHAGKPRPWYAGEKNHFWKGGIHLTNRSVRSSSEYKSWRKQICLRDNYTCQICNKKSYVDLRANHIKKFSDYPELRFELSNGIVICKSCDIEWVFRRELEWESYFIFNLQTRGII